MSGLRSEGIAMWWRAAITEACTSATVLSFERSNDEGSFTPKFDSVTGGLSSKAPVEYSLYQFAPSAPTTTSATAPGYSASARRVGKRREERNGCSTKR